MQPMRSQLQLPLVIQKSIEVIKFFATISYVWVGVGVVLTSVYRHYIIPTACVIHVLKGRFGVNKL